MAQGRIEYRRQLDELETDLLAIADNIRAMIDPVCQALIDGDALAADRTATWNGELRGSFRALEDDCFVFVARQAPVGTDLRLAFAVMRSIHELERAAKLLTHIAETLRENEPPTRDPALRAHFRMLGAATERIFTAGVAAWRRRDGLAINELELLDDEADELQERLIAQLYLDRHPVEVVASATLAARWHERVADHGVELARHVSWAVTGDRADAALR